VTKAKMAELPVIPVQISEAIVISDLKKKIDVLERQKRTPRTDLQKMIEEFENDVKVVEQLTEKHKAEKDVISAEVEILKQELAEQVTYQQYMEERRRSLKEKLEQLDAIRNEKDDLLRQKLELTKLSIGQQLSNITEANEVQGLEDKKAEEDEEEAPKLERVNTPDIIAKVKTIKKKIAKKNSLPRVASLGTPRTV